MMLMNKVLVIWMDLDNEFLHDYHLWKIMDFEFQMSK